MNTLLLRPLDVRSGAQVQSFSQWKEAESDVVNKSSVTTDGELVEYSTLELRVHPPQVSRCLIGRKQV